MKDPHLRIIPYNPEYPKIFNEIKEFICGVIPYPVQIEHVGSTAVPGLGGREIIDVLVIAEQEYMRRIAELLEARGFRCNPQASIPLEKLFVSGPYKYKGREYHVHIHITFKGSREHEEKLLFRDYLRENPEEAKRYYGLKKMWMEKAGSDPSRYRKCKAAYIRAVLKNAGKEFSKRENS